MRSIGGGMLAPSSRHQEKDLPGGSTTAYTLAREVGKGTEGAAAPPCCSFTTGKTKEKLPLSLALQRDTNRCCEINFGIDTGTAIHSLALTLALTLIPELSSA